MCLSTSVTEDGLPTLSPKARQRVDIGNRASFRALYGSGQGGGVYDNPVGRRTIMMPLVGVELVSQDPGSWTPMGSKVRIRY